MKRLLLIPALTVGVAAPVAAQTQPLDYDVIASEVGGVRIGEPVLELDFSATPRRLSPLTPSRLDRIQERRALTPPLTAPAPTSQPLGRLTSNRFLPDSTSNPYGRYGSRYSPDSINNPHGRYGSPYSPQSATNPYATRAPRLVGQDGTYLGRLSANPYDPESTSNPYGRYGSRYSPDSITNPYGRFGSPYSPLSPWNPYTTTPPIIVSDRR